METQENMQLALSSAAALRASGYCSTEMMFTYTEGEELNHGCCCRDCKMFRSDDVQQKKGIMMITGVCTSDGYTLDQRDIKDCETVKHCRWFAAKKTKKKVWAV